MWIGLAGKLLLSESLFYCLIQPRNPVLASNGPLARMFIEGMLTGEPVEFIYIGGSKPGSPRSVSGSLVFHHEAEGHSKSTPKICPINVHQQTTKQGCQTPNQGLVSALLKCFSFSSQGLPCGGRNKTFQH